MNHHNNVNSSQPNYYGENYQTNMVDPNYWAGIQGTSQHTEQPPPPPPPPPVNYRGNFQYQNTVGQNGMNRDNYYYNKRIPRRTNQYNPPYNAQYNTQQQYQNNWQWRPPPMKRPFNQVQPDTCEAKSKGSKKKKKPLSQNVPKKDWTLQDADRALAVEKEFNKRFKSHSLIIKFPDLELNRDIVSKFHPAIENVHFQQPSTPRFCFVTLQESANAEEVIKSLNDIKFGYGNLIAEFKKDRDEDQNITASDIDPLTLYVGNLAQEITKEDMVKTFPSSRRIDIGYAKKMKYTRYAFVSFNTVNECIEAFKKTHNTQLHSKSLIVRFRRLCGTVGMPGEVKPNSPKKKTKADETNENQVDLTLVKKENETCSNYSGGYGDYDEYDDTQSSHQDDSHSYDGNYGEQHEDKYSHNENFASNTHHMDNNSNRNRNRSNQQNAQSRHGDNLIDSLLELHKPIIVKTELPDDYYTNERLHENERETSQTPIPDSEITVPKPFTIKLEPGLENRQQPPLPDTEPLTEMDRPIRTTNIRRNLDNEVTKSQNLERIPTSSHSTIQIRTDLKPKNNNNNAPSNKYERRTSTETPDYRPKMDPSLSVPLPITIKTEPDLSKSEQRSPDFSDIKEEPESEDELDTAEKIASGAGSLLTDNFEDVNEDEKTDLYPKSKKRIQQERSGDEVEDYARYYFKI